MYVNSVSTRSRELSALSYSALCFTERLGVVGRETPQVSPQDYIRKGN